MDIAVNGKITALADKAYLTEILRYRRENSVCSLSVKNWNELGHMFDVNVIFNNLIC